MIIMSHHILVIVFCFLLSIGCAGLPASAQDHSESSIHELPEADRCSVIILHIRDLAFSLKQAGREIRLLEQPARQAFGNSEEYNRQMEQYDQLLEELRQKESSLRSQIDLKEQQLQDCLEPPSPPH